MGVCLQKVPVEVTPWCSVHTAAAVLALPAVRASGGEPSLRLGSSANNKRDGDAPAVTDNGN